MGTVTRKKTTKSKKNVIGDPTSGFKNVQIKNLASRVQTIRIEKQTHDAVRQLIGVRTNELLRKIIVFTSQDGRKTVKIDDLRSALNSEGKFLMAGCKTAQDIKKLKSKSKTKTKQPEEGTSTDTPKKTRRVKPSTAAKKSIKVNQENSNKLVFKQSKFTTYVREQTKKHTGESFRFQKEFFKLFQEVIEQYIVEILERANKAATHAKRKTLKKEDIDFVLSI